MNPHATITSKRLAQFVGVIVCLWCSCQVGFASNTDQRVFALIDGARSAAETVIIDGLHDPAWGAIPSVADPADSIADGTRDIVNVTFAPLASAWLVRIETRAAPSTEDLAFWLDIEYRGYLSLDLQLGLYLGFDDVLWTYPEDDAPSVQNWEASTLAIGAQVVEVEIPLTALASVLPSEMASDLTGAGARPWLRVTPFTRTLAGEVLDRGPAVGSYRLLTTPYDLDGPEPTVSDDPSPATAVPLPSLPANTQLLVGQGADGQFTHGSTWAYDLFAVDAQLEPGSPVGSSNNADYYSFGEPLVAPRAGTVWSVEAGMVDAPPLADPCSAGPPNFLFVDFGDGSGLLASHQQQNSITQVATDPIATGDELGRIGHSGSCSWPHVHLEAQSIGGGFPSRPIVLEAVDVSLSPGLDPWRRQVEDWAPREGLLVEPALYCGETRIDPWDLVFCDGFESGTVAGWSGTP